jgi:hypothetical protein
VQNAALRLNNWGGAAQAVYGGQRFTNYTYRFDVTTDAGNNGNAFRALFNYIDDANYTFLEIGGGSANTVRLGQRRSAGETTLATYAGSLSINGPTTVAITVSNGVISVSGTRDGSTTPLFANISGATGGGNIGVAGNYIVADVDNLSVVAGT